MTPDEEPWWTYPVLWVIYTVIGIARWIGRRFQ